MVIKIKEELISARIATVVFPVQDYPVQINQLVSILGIHYMKVLYVSLNRLYNPLKRKLEDTGLDSSKFRFIDCVTRTAVAQPTEHEDCVYVSSPSALTEISIAITKVIQKDYPDVILFDSLSTLLIYHNTMNASQFVHSLINKINAFGINAVFTVLDGEKEQSLINDLAMFSDKTIKIDPNQS
ncbi:hypothetical protein GOV05_01140 [Candidatus Woesearchaeota archaeon]|nr:hypothetical protein [Candidatus Woesearchaeota archaeon]